MDLADEYIKFEKTITPETTVNDFFDYAGVPMHRRSDFVFGCIMKQVEEKERMQKAREEGNAKLDALKN